MDVNSIAGSALLMKTSQTQEALSISMVKMAAQQQDQMVNILAQSAQQTSKLAQQTNNDFNFSIYV